jgi:putative transposase
MTVRQRQPRDVLHHSDQGTQYIAALWTAMQERRHWPSMGSVGDAYAKCHLRVVLRKPRVRAPRTAHIPHPRKARMAVFRYIEGWYNPRRSHTAVDYKLPASYEKLHSLG